MSIGFLVSGLGFVMGFGFGFFGGWVVCGSGFCGSGFLVGWWFVVLVFFGGWVVSMFLDFDVSTFLYFGDWESESESGEWGYMRELLYRVWVWRGTEGDEAGMGEG